MKSEILTGFPYRLRHACKLAELLGSMMEQRSAKKGVITDLDNTLWAGILGDDGVENISWHMDRHTHLHGLYQQFLASLAGAGVLVAVATKNDASLVERAFDRQDLLISRNDIFPLEAHWSSKVHSIRRILESWNVHAESVVFIDDNPLEIAEAQAAFPELECILFPASDSDAVWRILGRLRDAFGKQFLTEDDSLRLQSIRNGSVWRGAPQLAAVSSDNVLRSADSFIRFDLGPQQSGSRAFELINKTNQFNLNGKRLSQSEWVKMLNDPDSFLLTATYEDKYGRLGTIAAMLGRKDGQAVHLSAWVMSCRAFSRRIEHQCLSYLFKRFEVEDIVLDYKKTPRNGPLETCLAELIEKPPEPGVRLSKTQFMVKTPQLFHRVKDSDGA